MMRISNFLKVLFLTFCVSFLTNCGSGSSGNSSSNSNSNSGSNDRVPDSSTEIKVTLLNPANGATKVLLSPRIQLLFNKSVLNVNIANVTLRRGSVDGHIVPIGTITESLNNIYEFRPTSKLDRLTTYYVVLESGITDISKRGKLTQSNFSFTTDEGEWDYVGSPEFIEKAYWTTLAISPDGAPYLGYEDGRNSSRATVMKFNGESWVSVGSPGFSIGTVLSPSLAISPEDGMPYLGYSDGGNASKATVMKFNGESWVNVGSPGISTVSHTILTISPNGTPYLAYYDWGNSGRATVMKFNGESWTNVGSLGFSATVNNNKLSLAISPDGTPYLGYEDGRNSNKAAVMKFNGESWIYVGSPGISVGTVWSLSLAISPDGTPYFAYYDGGNSGRATVMKFNGESWVNIGFLGFLAGDVWSLSLAISRDGAPYLGYSAGGNLGKATVMKFR